MNVKGRDKMPFGYITYCSRCKKYVKVGECKHTYINSVPSISSIHINCRCSKLRKRVKELENGSRNDNEKAVDERRI